LPPTKSLTDTLDDPEFRKLSPDAQKIVLGHYGVSDEVQGKLLSKIAQPSVQSPIIPPQVKPPDVGIHKSYLLGDPNKDPDKAGQEDLDTVAKMATGTVKSLARVSPVNATYQLLRKKVPSLGLPEGLGIPSPEEIVTTGVGLMEGVPEDAEFSGKPRTSMPEPPLEPEQQAKYTESLDKANKGFAEDTAKYQKKVADAALERKRGFAGEPGGPHFEAEKAANRKDVLSRSSMEHTRLAHENLQQTYASARASLDSRWGQFRTKMEGVQLNPTETLNKIEAAKAKYLKGSPSSLQLFNNLARELGIQDFEELPNGTLKAVPGSGELPFDTARVHYSAIGDKLSQGNLPGNVYQALKSVSEGLDKQLTKGAEERGAGQEYTGLKANEHDFRSDWTDSKSPLAKAYKAQDPNFLHGHLTGKGSDLLMKQLAKYRQYGARPYLTAAARRLDAEAGAIKVPKTSGLKEFSAKKPALEEVKRPQAKPDTSPKAGKISRTIGRIGGHIVGGSVGSKLGHPLMGYSIGGEVGTEAAERIARRRMPPPPQ
jgi:hypothetical protein